MGLRSHRRREGSTTKSFYIDRCTYNGVLFPAQSFWLSEDRVINSPSALVRQRPAVFVHRNPRSRFPLCGFGASTPVILPVGSFLLPSARSLSAQHSPTCCNALHGHRPTLQAAVRTCPPVRIRAVLRMRRYRRFSSPRLLSPSERIHSSCSLLRCVDCPLEHRSRTARSRRPPEGRQSLAWGGPGRPWPSRRNPASCYGRRAAIPFRRDISRSHTAFLSRGTPPSAMHELDSPGRGCTRSPCSSPATTPGFGARSATSPRAHVCSGREHHHRIGSRRREFLDNVDRTIHRWLYAAPPPCSG